MGKKGKRKEKENNFIKMEIKKKIEEKEKAVLKLKEEIYMKVILR